MLPFFIITDVLRTGKRQYVTGYWDGDKLVESVASAKRYSTISDADVVLETGSFYDPVLREVIEDPNGVLNIGQFIDKTNQYGRFGGK